MALTRLAIRNFRGIRQAHLDFDAINLLIGENGTGKSSLFDALVLALGSNGGCGVAAFRAADFHRPKGGKGGAIAITLELAEPRPGQWRCLDAAALQPVVRNDATGVRMLSLRLHARRDRSGAIHARAEALDWEAPRRCMSLDDAHLEALRQASPVVVLRGGRLMAGAECPPDGSDSGCGGGGTHTPGADTVNDRLEAFHRRLSGGVHAQPEASMREGLSVAREADTGTGRCTQRQWA